MARRRLLVLAVAPLLALAGCGGAATTPSATAPDAVSAALATTLASGSARTVVTLHTGAPGQSLDVAGEGLVDFTDRTSEHVFRLPAELGDGPVELVAADGLWLRTPDTGGRYVDVAGPVGTALLDLVATGDPLAQLSVLAAPEHVREVGPTDVGGVPTTRYEARVPVDAAGGPLAAALADGGLDTVTVVADVDAEGRLRRVAPALGAGGGAGLWATVELSDFGVPVDVTAPSPDQVDEAFLDDLYEEALDALGNGEGDADGGAGGLAPPDLGEVLAGVAVLLDELSA